MRRFPSFLIGGAIIAWMAYLSWPVTAEYPAARSEAVVPLTKSKPHLVVPEMEAFQYVQPKSAEPSV